VSRSAILATVTRARLGFALATVASQAQEAAAPIKACVVLMPQRTGGEIQGGRPGARLDTGRIQAALTLCNPGLAAALESDGAKNAFESAPFVHLRRGA
jgi:hypothetical protein